MPSNSDAGTSVRVNPAFQNEAPGLCPRLQYSHHNIHSGSLRLSLHGAIDVLQVRLALIKRKGCIAGTLQPPCPLRKLPPPFHILSRGGRPPLWPPDSTMLSLSRVNSCGHSIQVSTRARPPGNRVSQFGNQAPGSFPALYVVPSVPSPVAWGVVNYGN